MERRSFSNSLQDHSAGKHKELAYSNKFSHYHYQGMLKSSCSSKEDGQTNTVGVGGSFSWSPRSYSCSFCKRQFRSAQALGGHMNVHRRERARLRQTPPPLNGHGYPIMILNPNPNPNPNPSPELSLSNFPTSTSRSSPCPMVSLGRPHTASPSWSTEIGATDFQPSHSKEEVDLELRLGYS